MKLHCYSYIFVHLNFLLLTAVSAKINTDHKTIKSISPLFDKSKMEQIENVRMNGEQYGRVELLHKNWYAGAINSLLGAVGREVFLKMDKKHRKAFIECLDAIKNDDDIQSGAKCLVAAWDGKLLTLEKSTREEQSAQKEVFRKARSMKAVMLRLNKRSKFAIQKTRRSAQKLESASRAKRMALWREKANEEQSFAVKSYKEAPKLYSSTKASPDSPIKVIAQMFTNFIRAADYNESRIGPWKHSYNRLKQLNQLLEKHRNSKKYKQRMLDVVVDFDAKYRHTKSISERISDMIPQQSKQQLPKLMPHLFNLVEAMGNNSKQSNLRFLSPQLASVVNRYDEQETTQFLSPSFFPLYADKSSNTILPIPHVLESTGMSSSEKNSMMELIMEASGAGKIVEDVFEIIKNKTNLSGLIEEINGITDVISSKFTELKQSMNGRQRRDLQHRKYTFMTKQQLSMVYGQEGLYNLTTNEMPFDLSGYCQYGEVERKRALMAAIRQLAAGHRPMSTKNAYLRHKRQAEEGVFLGAPEVFEHVTLSPFSFAPLINTPVFSPMLGSPLVLSPFVFGPNTFSAAVFDPYILSPYVLSPNVLNPWVASPLILSPHVLSPDFMSPTVLGGAILNPYVMSPAIFTESALAIDILSPSLFS